MSQPDPDKTPDPDETPDPDTPDPATTLGEASNTKKLLRRPTDEDPGSAAKTLLVYLREAAAKFGDRPAIRFQRSEAWETITYAQLWRRASELALGFRAAGVTKDDRVLILAENGPEILVAELAAIACRAVSVVLFPKYAAHVLRQIIDQTSPRLAVVESGATLARYLDARKDSQDRIKVISWGDGVPGPRGEVRALGAVSGDGRRRIERCLAEATGDPFQQLVDRTRASDPITIAYSMGGSRAPHGAILSHDNIVPGELAKLFGPPRADDLALVQIPLAQPFARLSVCYGLLLAGATISFPRKDELVLEALAATSPTMLFLFPTALEALKKQIKDRVSGGPKWTQGAFEWALKKARTSRAERQARPPWLIDRLILSRIRGQLGGRLRFAYVGGGVADGDLLSFLQDAGIATYEGYSLAEGTPLAGINTPDDTDAAESVRYDRGIVGRPAPGIEVKVDPEGYGEICVKGLVNMKGYWREEAEAKAVLSRDGWLRTGDLGYIDPQGYIVIQDRKADTFRLSDGNFVAPAVVEAELHKSPMVRDVCVVGRGRAFPIALVVPDFKELAKRVYKTEPELARKATRRSLLSNPASRVAATIELLTLASKLAETPWAQPRAIRLLSIEFTEAVELTPAGTLRRRAIEDRFKNQIEAVYAELASEEASLASAPVIR